MIKNLKQLWGWACVAGGLFGKREKTLAKRARSFSWYLGRIQEFLMGVGSGGGGGPKFGSERTVELFCGK